MKGTLTHPVVYPGTPTLTELIPKLTTHLALSKEILKPKTVKSERLRITRLFACSWSTGPLWDPHTKQKILKLEKVQYRAAQWTTNNYDYRSSVTAMLQALGWQSLEQRWTDARLCLFYQIVLLRGSCKKFCH